MTVGTTNYFTDWLAANGSNKNWAYTFPIPDEDSVVVMVRDAANPTAITEYRTNLTLVPVDNDNGTVVYPAIGSALPVGKEVRIVREVDYTQITQIGTEGAFNPEIHERAFDKLTMIAQQLYGTTTRSLRFPLGDTVTELPTDRAGHTLAFDNSGNPINGPTPGEIANAATNAAAAAASAVTAETQAGIAADNAAAAAASAAEAASFSGVARRVISFTASAGQTVFPLGETLPNTAACDVYHEGVKFPYGSDNYTLTATTLTLTNAAAAGEKVEVFVISSYAVAGALVPANNLSDVANQATARTNLGLGTSAVLAAGSGANQALQLDAQGNVPSPVGVAHLLAAQATTSGTFKDFDIPANATKISVKFGSFSTSGSSLPQIQLGTAAAFETTGYNCTAGYIQASPGVPDTQSKDTGFVIFSGSAGNALSGIMHIEKLTGNRYVAEGSLGVGSGAAITLTTGDKSLSDVLTRIRVTTVNGTDTFDAGMVGVTWE